jgi:hypothetical protein
VVPKGLDDFLSFLDLGFVAFESFEPNPDSTELSSLCLSRACEFEIFVRQSPLEEALLNSSSYLFLNKA